MFAEIPQAECTFDLYWVSLIKNSWSPRKETLWPSECAHPSSEHAGSSHFGGHRPLRAVGLKLQHASESPRDLRKHRPLGGPHAQSLWFRRSGQGLRICISSTFPGDADAVRGPHVENHHLREFGESSIPSPPQVDTKLIVGVYRLSSSGKLVQECWRWFGVGGNTWGCKLLNDMKLVWWVS